MEKTDPNYCPGCGIHKAHASPGCEEHTKPNPLAPAPVEGEASTSEYSSSAESGNEQPSEAPAGQPAVPE